MFNKMKKWLTILFAFFRGKQGTYYIGGHASLPKPLTREEEAKVIQAFMDGDAEARDTLIEKFTISCLYCASF